MEYLIAGSVEEALRLMEGLAGQGRSGRFVAGGTTWPCSWPAPRQTGSRTPWWT